MLDPANREIDPETDKLWNVDVSVWLSMSVVAPSREEAEECAEAYWTEELSAGGVDFTPMVADLEHERGNDLPRGPIMYQGKELTRGQVAQLLLTGKVESA